MNLFLLSLCSLSHYFDIALICRQADATVTVKNDGELDLTIGTITSPSNPFSKITDNCSGQTLAPSATCTITYRFSPTSMGTFNSNSNIPSNDPDPYENPVTVSLSGTGINNPPVADPNGPYTGIEGQPITLNGSGSYDPDGSIALYE